MSAVASSGRVRKIGVIWLLLLVAACLPRSTQALNDLPFQYTRQVWHIQDGLPEETVQAVQQTPDGYLWIGTTADFRASTDRDS